MASLLETIERVRRKQFEDHDWLYIAGSADNLTPHTEADLGCPDIDEDSNQEILPDGFGERGLASTIDIDTVAACIEWADQLSEACDNIAAADVIRYYIRFDAWPQTLNSPDPPQHEILRNLDREFCDQLGPENPSKQCRQDGCKRGVIKLSVFCRRHHFEKVRKRPYPFDD